MGLIPTPSQTVGPFFHFELTTDEHCVRCIAGPAAKGERIWISFSVLDGDGAPVSDAMLEIWQADANGVYNHPDDPQHEKLQPGWLGFGRLASDEDGRCELETIRPGRVGNQAPHFNVAIFARGMLKQLFTRVYLAGDPGNSEDPVLGLVPEERRKTLLAQPDASHPGHWQFNVRLQGEEETVFFEV